MATTDDITHDGTSASDIITGSVLGDIIMGNGGDDQIDGLDGTDIAVYSGSWHDYDITAADGVYTIADRRDGFDGTDTLNSIEYLRFADTEAGTGAAVSQAPLVAQIRVLEMTEGERFAFNASNYFLDPNVSFGDTLTFKLSGAPSWLKIKKDTGLISGQPGATDAADAIRFTVTATDSRGLSASTEMTLRVLDKEEPPIGSGDDMIVGTQADDELYGLDGVDTLYGLAGNDRLDGGNHSDRLEGGNGKDRLFGGGRIDKLFGDAGADKLFGQEGGDTLEGGAGNDKLNGGDGQDFIYSDGGRDTLIGGRGKDHFVFRLASDSAPDKSNRDVIVDFSLKQYDRLHLEDIDAKLGPRNDVFNMIDEREFTGKAGQLRYEQTESKTFLYGDIDGDRKAEFTIEFLKVLDLAKAEIIF